MKDLEHDFIMLCKRLRHGSHATQHDRRQILLHAAQQLDEGGFKYLRATSLKEKHVGYLLDRWKSENLSTGTIKNRIAAMRWWAEAVGKPGILPSNNAQLGISPRQYAGQGNKAQTLDAGRLDKITDPYAHMSLQMQAAFGLRREESIKIRPEIADQKNVLYLKGSWCKGGRERVIPIRTAEQRAVLDTAHRLAGAGALIPADKSYIQQRSTYDGQTQAAGLNNMHGLRHQYAQNRYEELTGWKSPKAGGPARNTLTDSARKADEAARMTISKELGHGRIGIVSVYCG
jgi:hypothetical protein